MDTIIFILIGLGTLSGFIGTLAGGGGLITLPAMLLMGVPIQMGIATNKFATAFGALTSVSYLFKSKTLDIQTIILNLFLGVLGGVCGALITTSISEKTMNVIAMILLAFALFVTLKSKKWVSQVEAISNSTSLKSKIILFFISLYDGGFGPGSTTFGIIHFMGRNFNYVKAVQLTRVVILGSCVGAFIVFYQTGFVEWHYAIGMAIGSAIGSQLGMAALPHIPLKVAKSLLITILCLLIGQLMFKMV
ncbi:sulfite exporter TauE/SafE family protein [Peribacillus acanthi]|uniref:sulfite exporter TauE/SafE family protein n=1 Tax=Peribacillus acanthi TaxID=2171554 RepID=UPI000D3EA28F|nr:sulfite exporter TauE/SafE family protein [Peribacillus acanthi]